MNTTENKLTHFDAEGNAVMVDVSGKPVTSREATAHGIITMNKDAFAAVQNGTVKKGDVLGVARVAGIMATKRTSELIPLCHPLPLTKVHVSMCPSTAIVLTTSPCPTAATATFILDVPAKAVVPATQPTITMIPTILATCFFFIPIPLFFFTFFYIQFIPYVNTYELLFISS